MQNKPVAKGFQRAGKPAQAVVAQAAPAPKAQPTQVQQVSNEKAPRKFAQNHVGYVSRGKPTQRNPEGALMLKIEQDMILNAGDIVIFNTPQDVLASKFEAGFLKNQDGTLISEDRLAEMQANVPDWKLYEASKMKPKA